MFQVQRFNVSDWIRRVEFGTLNFNRGARYAGCRLNPAQVIAKMMVETIAIV